MGGIKSHEEIFYRASSESPDKYIGARPKTRLLRQTGGQSRQKEIDRIGSKEKISLVWLCKNRDKDWDVTRGTRSDWQEDWSLELLGQGFMKQRDQGPDEQPHKLNQDCLIEEKGNRTQGQVLEQTGKSWEDWGR